MPLLLRNIIQELLVGVESVPQGLSSGLLNHFWFCVRLGPIHTWTLTNSHPFSWCQGLGVTQQSKKGYTWQDITGVHLLLMMAHTPSIWVSSRSHCYGVSPVFDCDWAVHLHPPFKVTSTTLPRSRSLSSCHHSASCGSWWDGHGLDVQPNKRVMVISLLHLYTLPNLICTSASALRRALHRNLRTTFFPPQVVYNLSSHQSTYSMLIDFNQILATIIRVWALEEASNTEACKG